MNVIVSWTLSGGESADLYFIGISTNAPQTPYGGLLYIATASVTQRELTGFMTGYEYNITVRGVTSNCGGLVGRESEPLTIRINSKSIIVPNNSLSVHFFWYAIIGTLVSGICYVCPSISVCLCC